MSRVIHRQDRVSATTCAPVQSAIGNLDYVPGGAARSLPRRRKEVIGFISVECLGRPRNVENKNPIYDHEVLRGVQRRISGLGLSLLVTFWNGEAGQDFR